MKVVGYNFICYLSYMIIGMIMFMLNVISFQIPLTTEDQYSEGKRNILENEELKSDIFHIKLNMSGTFKLTLPIHDKPRPHGFNREIQYAELIVKISHKTLGQDKVTATKAVYSHGKVSLGFARLFNKTSNVSQIKSRYVRRSRSPRDFCLSVLCDWFNKLNENRKNLIKFKLDVSLSLSLNNFDSVANHY